MDNTIPSNSIDAIFKHIESGHSVYFTTYTRHCVITKKTLANFRKAGAWLLKEDGTGYRMQTGKSSVYLLAGQLKYGL
jgi:hypothetical protein